MGIIQESGGSWGPQHGKPGQTFASNPQVTPGQGRPEENWLRPTLQAKGWSMLETAKQIKSMNLSRVHIGTVVDDIEVARRKLHRYVGIYIKGTVEGVAVNFMVDTCASATVVSSKDL